METIKRRCVQCPDAPKPAGPYSHAVIVGTTAYIAGLIGNDPKTAELVSDDTVEQADQALKNLGTVLKHIDATYNNVVKITLLLADIKDFAKVNEIYLKYFPDHHPARAAYQVAAMPKGAKLEIESIAVLGNIEDV